MNRKGFIITSALVAGQWESQRKIFSLRLLVAFLQIHAQFKNSPMLKAMQGYGVELAQQ